MSMYYLADKPMHTFSYRHSHTNKALFALIDSKRPHSPFLTHNYYIYLSLYYMQTFSRLVCKLVEGTIKLEAQCSP